MSTALCVDVTTSTATGKLTPPASIGAAAGKANHTKRLIVTDKRAGTRFLVDTGADVSVLPHTWFKSSRPTERKLYAANRSAIPTFGEKKLTLDIGLRRCFTWTFIVADVTQPILGNDFLHEYNLIPDLRGRRLLDATTSLTVAGLVVGTKNESLTTVKSDNKYHELLRKYIGVTRSAKFCEPRHPVRHHIVTKGPSCTDRARRLSQERFRHAKREIEEWIADGIINPSSSPFSSAMLMRRKKDGTWRIFGAYRQLNKMTLPDKYPVPHLRDFAHKLHKQNVFTTLDLERAYFNIPVADEDKKKTALITPFGLFEFNVMPFGLANAAQSFQRFMDNILRGLGFCFCYIDDILIASHTPEEHTKHLEQVLARLQDHGLTIKEEKCNFRKNEVDYLGHRVTPDGIKPLDQKVRAISEFTKPKNPVD